MKVKMMFFFKNYNLPIRSFITFFFLGFGIFTFAIPGDVCTNLPATSIGGNVWEDFNFNGIRDEANLFGVSGITINVYGCDGVLMGSPSTDIDGDWSLDISSAPSCNGCTEVRIEYANLPADAEPTMVGTNNGSTIQIVSPGTCTGLGVILGGTCPSPFDYTTPLGNLFPLSKSLMGPGIVFVTCGVFEGVPLNDRFSAGLMDVRSLTPDNDRTQVIPPMYHHSSWHIDSIGNVYGLDYDTLGNMYVSASSHFGAGYGFAGDVAIIRYGGIGGGAEDLNAAGTVYKFDKETGQASVFTVLPQLQFSFTNSSCEGSETSVRNTGVGLGNMVYDKNNNQFFISNFEDGKIYRVDDEGTIIDSFDPQTLTGFTADDNNPGPAPDAKPYGLAINPNGTKLFFGTSELDLTPNLYSIDLTAAGAFSGTEVFHGEYLGEGLVGGGYAIAPSWISISDLEFLPDGNLMIGMRTGCQGSYFNSHNHGGTFYIVEAADVDGLFDDLVTNPDIQYANDFSPNNLATDGSDGTANDDGYGGIGIWDKHDGTWDYALTSADIREELGPHGLIVFPSDYTETGNGTTEYAIRPSTAISYFGSLNVNDIKGVGGDAAVFSECPIVLTEIGNKIWLDINENGIQDACESGVENMDVGLYDTNGNLLATATSDINGNYYFNEDGGTNQTWENSGDRVLPDSSYYLVFGNGQFSNDEFSLDGNPFLLTTDSVGSASNNFELDSDAEIATGLSGGLASLNGLPITSIHTGEGGTVDHSLDLGLIPVFDWGDLPDATAATTSGDYQTDSTNNGPEHMLIAGLRLGNIVDWEHNGQSSTSADGDDLNGDDEDGIGLQASLQINPGGVLNIPLSVTNTTGNTAHLEMWIDWDGDGDFDGMNEMVADLDDTSAFPGYIQITVPEGAVQNQNIGLRIRLSNQDNMTPYGLILSGEVEDYLIQVACSDSKCLNVTSVTN